MTPDCDHRVTALEQEGRGPMTINPDDHPLADDVPVDDAAEQRQPADDSTEDVGLDLDEVADLLERDANPADVIEQAIVVPLPDDDDGADAK
jgi:hypothetical protein